MSTTAARRSARVPALLLLAVGMVAAVGTGVAVGDHGGDPPRYGDGESCRVVDFTYTDGHTDHFIACGAYDTNDLTPAEIPTMHVRELHTSCSDVFPGGVFEKGDPTSDAHDGNHTVARYAIEHYDDLANDTEPTKQCTETFVETLPIVVCVDIVNDAGGDGTYTDAEVADAEGRDAPERITVTNCGDDPVIVDSLSVATDGGAEEDVCPELLGAEMAAGATAGCDIVQTSHTPPVGDTLTDVVTVVVHQPDNAINTATATDDTAMSTVTPPVTVCVDLVNDADGDGTSTDDETATGAGQDVDETVTVTNCGDEPVQLDTISISTDGADGQDVCPSLVGTVLEPDEAVVCELTQEDLSPEAGGATVDTVTVTGSHPDDAAVTDDDSDPTTVRSPDDATVDDASVDESTDDATVDAADPGGADDGGDDPVDVGAGGVLPDTGGEAGGLGGTGTALILLGSCMVGYEAIRRQYGYARTDIARWRARR